MNTRYNSFKSIGSGAVALTMLVASALAGDEAKNLNKIVEEGPYIETAQKGIKLSGYLDTGYTYNYTSPNAIIKNRGLTSDSNPLGDFNLHALHMTLEKPLTDANELQAGFRTDLWLGEDASGFNGDGNGDSDGHWLQQAYVIVRVPWGNGLDISIGKMGAYLGFEADERPDNINITPGNNAAIDPAKMTGISLEYPLSDSWKYGLMVANGSGQDNDTGLDNSGDSAIIASYIGYSNKDNFESQLGVHLAPNGDSGYGGALSNGTSSDNRFAAVVNWWNTWVPKFAKEKLLLASNASFAQFEGKDNGVYATDANEGFSSNWYSVALYGKYQFTEVVSLGSRVEYVHTSNDRFLNLGTDFDGQGAGSNFNAGSSDIWGWTTTLGFNLACDLLLRLEYRLDYGENLVNTSSQSAGAAYTSSNMVHTTAIQVVYSF